MKLDPGFFFEFHKVTGGNTLKHEVWTDVFGFNSALVIVSTPTIGIFLFLICHRMRYYGRKMLLPDSSLITTEMDVHCQIYISAKASHRMNRSHMIVGNCSITASTYTAIAYSFPWYYSNDGRLAHGGY